MVSLSEEVSRSYSPRTSAAVLSDDGEAVRLGLGPSGARRPTPTWCQIPDSAPRTPPRLFSPRAALGPPDGTTAGLPTVANAGSLGGAAASDSRAAVPLLRLDHPPVRGSFVSRPAAVAPSESLGAKGYGSTRGRPGPFSARAIVGRTARPQSRSSGSAGFLDPAGISHRQ